jgi:hypothetical protein
MSGRIADMSVITFRAALLQSGGSAAGCDGQVRA